MFNWNHAVEFITMTVATGGVKESIYPLDASPRLLMKLAESPYLSCGKISVTSP
jgi:hypothetical protein